MSINFVNDFHKKVRANPKQFCRKIHCACDMIDKLLKRKDIEFKENDVIAFDKMCGLFNHWKGTKKKIKLDITQKWIMACTLGIKIQNKDGEWVRYFQECRVFVAKKYGKSVLMALFAFWGLLFDREDGAEIYCVATKKEQAKIVFDNISVYLKQNRDIEKLAKKQYADGSHHIYCERNNGTIKYLSSSKNGLQGKNPSWVLFDESQEVKDFAVIEAVRTGMATRKQPMFVSMSTAGTTPNSAYRQMYSQIEAMCEQKKFDDKLRVFFAVFEIDASDDIADKTKWIKANPALLDGRPKLEYLEKEYELALIGAEKKSMPTFIAFHLNRSCDDAQTYYLSEEIRECKTIITTHDYYSQYAWGGVDLSQTTDLTCATILIVKQNRQNENDFEYIFLQRYFMAKERVEKLSQIDKIMYSTFEHTNSADEVCKNLLYLSEGHAVDHRDVTNFFVEMRDKYSLFFQKIGYDSAMSQQWVFSMKDAGFTEEKRLHNPDGTLHLRDEGQLTSVRQGKFLSPMIKDLKVLFEHRKVKFDSSNVLFPFCCLNSKVQIDNNNLRQVVKKHSNGRVDGLISALTAMMAFSCNKEIFIKEILPYEETRNRFN